MSDFIYFAKEGGVTEKLPPYAKKVDVLLTNGTVVQAMFGDNGIYFGEWGHKPLGFMSYDNNRYCQPVIAWRQI